MSADPTKTRFPNDTAVLAITTHGAIRTDESNNIVTFRVPEGMTITKMSVSPIGVCNMASADDSTDVVKTISSVFSDPDPKKTLEQRVQSVLPALKDKQGDVTTRVEKSQVRGTQKDPLIYNFLVYADRSQAVKTYRENDEIIDKDYVKNEGEGVDHPYDFKMPILNVPGNPDFLQLIIGGRFGMPTRSMRMGDEQYINLSTMVILLRQMKVKHIVLFDYSCSSFYELDDSLQRLLRREAEKKGLTGGKRRKTRRRKTKTKPRKSRRQRA